MKLNKQQREYAISRLSDKIREKCEKEMPEFIPSKLNDKDALYDLLDSCGVPLVPRERFNNIWGTNYITEVIVFPVYFDKEHVDNQRKRKEIETKYDNLKQQILDKLYLCDEAEEVLALINNI